jgi:DNA-directed RNA polymerase specialized sigma24 family protein
MSRSGEDAKARVAQVTVDSYGRLLAFLAAPTGDIASAEDAIADAIERALTRWPDDGVPDNPEGWILTVARNRLRDLWKSHGYRMTDPLLDIRCPRRRGNSGSPPRADAGVRTSGDRSGDKNPIDVADRARSGR